MFSSFSLRINAQLHITIKQEYFKFGFIQATTRKNGVLVDYHIGRVSSCVKICDKVQWMMSTEKAKKFFIIF